MKQTKLHVYLVCGRLPSAPKNYGAYVREHVVASSVKSAIDAVEELHPGVVIESASHKGADIVLAEAVL